MLKVNFMPLSDRVLIEPIATPTITEAGVILAQSETNAMPITGIIIAIGAGRMADQYGNTVPMIVKVGDCVTWSKFVGSHVVVDGHKLLIMREGDIAGILRTDAEAEAENYVVSDELPEDVVGCVPSIPDATCDEKDRS